MSKTCQHTMHGGRKRHYKTCDKPAKFIGPTGLFLCGVHRRVVDAAWKSEGKRCKAL